MSGTNVLHDLKVLIQSMHPVVLMQTIFRIHLRLRKQDLAAFDVAALAQAADGFSGAEIEQAVIAGLYKALHDKAPLSTAMLLEEIGQTSPLSVVRREDIARLRDTARGRFVPVK